MAEIWNYPYFPILGRGGPPKIPPVLREIVSEDLRRELRAVDSAAVSQSYGVGSGLAEIGPRSHTWALRERRRREVVVDLAIGPAVARVLDDLLSVQRAACIPGTNVELRRLAAFFIHVDRAW
jgi:hypothetical protein